MVAGFLVICVMCDTLLVEDNITFVALNFPIYYQNIIQNIILQNGTNHQLKQSEM